MQGGGGADYELQSIFCLHADCMYGATQNKGVRIATGSALAMTHIVQRTEANAPSPLVLNE